MLAPRCFGLFTCYNPKSDTCKGCEHERNCLDASSDCLNEASSVANTETFVRLQNIRRMELDKPKLEVKSAEVSQPAKTVKFDYASQANIPMNIPERDRKVLTALFKDGLDLRASKEANPFPSHLYPFMREGWSWIKRNSRSSKLSLRQHYQEVLSVSELSAKRYVSTFVNIAKSYELIKVEGQIIWSKL